MRAIVCALAIALSTNGIANAVLVAQWTFETSVPTTAGPHAAELGVNAGSGSPANGSHAGATVYSNPAGNGSPESFSSTNWLVGDHYQFRTSTSGYQSVMFSFDQTSSSTGPRDFQIQYSTNGTTFTPFTAGTTYMVLENGAPPNAAWNSSTGSPAYSYSFVLPAALNNQTSVFVRLVQNSTSTPSGGTVASGGTDRVDNVAFNAVAIPEPGAVLFGCLICCVAGFSAAWRRCVA